MGIKYNGNDVQAIYYNGLTIAKMMNNNNAVWAQPVNSRVYLSDFANLVPTVVDTYRTKYTHPNGYTGRGMTTKIVGSTIEATGVFSRCGITFFFPNFAGKDYKLRVEGNWYFTSSGQDSLMSAQGTGSIDNDNVLNGLGFLVRSDMGPTDIDYLIPIQKTSTNMTDPARAYWGTFKILTQASLSNTALEWTRVGTSLTLKVINLSTQAVVLETTETVSVPFDNTGNAVNIIWFQGGQITNFRMEIFD